MIPRVKILHVVNISFTLPYFIGDQFDHFHKRGVNFFVGCQPSDHFTHYAKKKGFVPIALNVLREVNVIEDIKAVFKLVKLIKNEKIDIVVGHTPKAGIIAMFAAYLAHVRKRIYFRHGVMFETASGLKRMVFRFIEMLTGKLATKVVCVSKSVMDLSHEQGLSDDKKNILLNQGSCNGIDAVMRFNPGNVNAKVVNELRKTYDIGDKDRVVGYVGRLVNDKGITELIGAWKLLLTKHCNIKLLLAGPLETRDELPKEVQEYILKEPTILNVGLIDDVTAYYTLMDMFVLPSYREGLPTVVLEASAMNLPVVTTRSTGCIDSIRENVTGIFTNIDSTDISKNIEVYLNDKRLASTHGRNGREFVLNNFGPATIWREIEERVFEISLDADRHETWRKEELHRAS